MGGCSRDYLLVGREWATRLAGTEGNGTHITQNSNFGGFTTTEKATRTYLATWWSVDTLQLLGGRMLQGLSLCWREWAKSLAGTAGNGNHNTQKSNFGGFNTTERQTGPNWLHGGRLILSKSYVG